MTTGAPPSGCGRLQRGAPRAHWLGHRVRHHRACARKPPDYGAHVDVIALARAAGPSVDLPNGHHIRFLQATAGAAFSVVEWTAAPGMAGSAVHVQTFEAVNARLNAANIAAEMGCPHALRAGDQPDIGRETCPFDERDHFARGRRQPTSTPLAAGSAETSRDGRIVSAETIHAPCGSGRAIRSRRAAAAERSRSERLRRGTSQVASLTVPAGVRACSRGSPRTERSAATMAGSSWLPAAASSRESACGVVRAVR
jgi:hypothetical protein